MPRLQLHDIRARIQRLEELANGLALEASAVRHGDDPLHYAGRQAYLKALHEAAGNLGAARLALVKAAQRLEGA